MVQKIKFVIYILVFFILFCFVFWGFYLISSIKIDSMSELFSKLFGAPKVYDKQLYDSKYNYLNYPEMKAENTIRIGIFGDSFSEGFEVEENLRWIALLNKWYQEDQENVEVINFSLSGYGYHDSFNLWEEKASKYNLDYVVFGPTQADLDMRDKTFNATLVYAKENQPLNHSSMLSLRPRYRNINDHLRLLKPVGNNNLEYFLSYWSFIPHLQYWKYDYIYPLPLRVVMSTVLRKHLIFGNPFYHNSNIDEEMVKVKTLMFQKIMKKVKRMKFMDYSFIDRQHSFFDDPSLLKDNYDRLLLTHRDRFFEKGFNHHDSPLQHYDKAVFLYNSLALTSQQKNNYIIDFEVNDQILSVKKSGLGDRELSKVSLVFASGKSLAELFDSSKEYNYFCKAPACSGINDSANGLKAILVIHDSVQTSNYFPVLGLEYDINEEISVEYFKNVKKIKEKKIDYLLGSSENIKFIKDPIFIQAMFQQHNTSLFKNVDADRIIFRIGARQILKLTKKRNGSVLSEINTRLLSFNAAKDSISNLTNLNKNEDILLKIDYVNGEKDVYSIATFKTSLKQDIHI